MDALTPLAALANLIDTNALSALSDLGQPTAWVILGALILQAGLLYMTALRR